VRSHNVLRALQQIGNVEVIVLRNSNEADDSASNLACGHNGSCALAIEQRPKKGLMEKAKWTLDPRSDYPNGCGVAAGDADRVLRSVSAFDLIWFNTLRAADMFPNAAWPCSVVDVDDVPSTYERAALETQGGLRERLLAARRVFSWKRREKLLGKRFTVLAVCSQPDRQYLTRMGVKAPIHVIPNGFDIPCAEPVHCPVAPPRIGFIGNFGHFPNREGIIWFADRCWPQIKHDVSEARLRLIGSGSDGPMKPRGPDIDGCGWLANVNDEIQTWSAMIVPVRVGAGTRVKIAQGFSQKCPVVSTSLGAYGYEAVDGQEIYIGDDSREFSNACIKAIREPANASQMAERAWLQFLKRWTWNAVRPPVWEAVEECLGRSGRGVAATGGTHQVRQGQDATPVGAH
jgi:polysaccharide biosynthesis protein PslH